MRHGPYVIRVAGRERVCTTLVEAEALLGVDKRRVAIYLDVPSPSHRLHPCIECGWSCSVKGQRCGRCAAYVRAYGRMPAA